MDLISRQRWVSREGIDVPGDVQQRRRNSRAARVAPLLTIAWPVD